MAFTINNNLGFINRMQFRNSSLDTLVNNFSEMDFKYLSEELSSELLQLARHKEVYPYQYSFKKFYDEKLPDRCNFFSFLKDECIIEKDYLHAINVLNVFIMNTMGDCYDII